jgi:hypothetical protein
LNVSTKGEGLRYLPTRIVGGIGFESLLTEQGETGSVEVERYVLEPLIRDTAAAIAPPLPISRTPIPTGWFWCCHRTTRFPTPARSSR